MDPDRRPYDRLRSWADGELPPEEAARLEADLRADPDLEAQAREYLEVHRATDLVSQGGPRPATGSRLRLEDVLAAAGPEVAPGRRAGRRPRQVLLAAAALVVVGVAALLATRTGSPPAPPAPPASGEPSPVVLSAVPIASPPARPPPTLLGEWRPVRDGEVRWLASVEEARAVAEFARRPVLVYAMHPTCPLCRAMEGGTLRDPGVTAAAERFVPLRLDVTRMPAAEVRRLFAEGWPYFAVESAGGAVLETFGGTQPADEFCRRLDEAWAARPPGPEAVGWNETEAAARDADGALRARDALLAARDLAPADPARAKDALARAASDLSGTRYAGDLALVLGRWNVEGRFPPLVEAPR